MIPLPVAKDPVWWRPPVAGGWQRGQESHAPLRLSSLGAWLTLFGSDAFLPVFLMLHAAERP